MLRLFLLRHAKSSWADPSLHDFDRPLNKRGKKDVPKIAALMQERNYHPDHILCSSAQRTRETLAGILPSLHGEVRLQLLDSLYEGNAPDYLAILRAHAEESKSLMLIGHNTGLQETALHLVGEGDAYLITAMEMKFPTAALAVLDFDCDNWCDVTNDSGKLVDFVKPKELTSSPEEIIIENPAPTFFRR